MRETLNKVLSIVGLKAPDHNDPLFDIESSYPPMPTPTACFYAKICRVKDGDTIEVEINKHHGQHQILVIRLLGIDARETRGPERLQGLSDKQYAEAWVQHAEDRATRDAYVVETVATEKYGRWLGWIWRTCDGANLNMDMFNSGHADKAPMDARAFLIRDVSDTMKGIEVG